MDYADAVSALRATGCVWAEDEARLLVQAEGDTGALVARRSAGEPLEQVLGWAAFAGLRLEVAPGTFVPRRRTELLAEQAVARLAAGDVAVELCCGVAPVAATILARVPGARVWAVDMDPTAVEVARRNAPAATVLCGDLLDPLPEALRGQLRVLAANTPYVPSAEVSLLPAEAREHEPRATLDGGPDGLHLLRRIAAVAATWLAPGGHLLIEVTDRQLPAASAAFEAAGLTPGVVRDEGLGAVVVTGQLREVRRS